MAMRAGAAITVANLVEFVMLTAFFFFFSRYYLHRCDKLFSVNFAVRINTQLSLRIVAYVYCYATDLKHDVSRLAVDKNDDV